MSNQHRILVLYLLMFCVRVLSNNNKDPSDDQCSLQCTTPKLHGGEIYTKCNISDPPKLNCSAEGFSLQFRNVSFLDLSDNKLNQVPSWMFPAFKNVTILSLAQNSFKTIESGAFKYLENLISLNLSFNDLREWRIDSNGLQSLTHLDVTGNEHWFPSEMQLLRLQNLKTVQGVNWTKYCTKCSLLKTSAIATEANLKSEWLCYNWYGSPSKWQWYDQIQYGKALDFIKVGFWPTCLCDDACILHQYWLPNFQGICAIITRALYSLYAVGSVALLVNITVVLLIVFQKSLRGVLTVCLILNVAVCDVIIGAFSLFYVRFNSASMYIYFYRETIQGNNEHVDNRMEKLMNIIGPILTCAVVSQVCGSFIMTMEKFLKIVFAMNPNIRIGKRIVMLYLVLSWSLSATFAVLPVFNVGGMTYHNGFIATPLPSEKLTYSYSDHEWKKNPVGIATGSQIVLIIMQLTSLVLYLPIFIVAKRSGATVGIQREATIAKKIALLVFTNLILFTVPLVLGTFQYEIFLEIGESMRVNWQNYSLSQYQWFGFAVYTIPALCVSINSVLNPFLYALRHPKIKQQLDTIIPYCRNALIECFVYLGQHLRCHSNIHPQNNNEMQETKF